MSKLAIYGASGHGRVAAEIAALNDWDDIVFFDENWLDIKNNNLCPVIGNFDILKKESFNFDGVFVAIGDSKIRINVINQLPPEKLITLVHPSAIISNNTKIEQASIIMPGTIINTNVKINRSCIINSGSIVEHDCTIEEGVHLAPGTILCANVNVKNMSWIGAASIVIQGIKIGKNVTIGAGSVVIRDVEDNIKVAGVPAKKIIKP